MASFTGKKILITGGGGFIGSNLAKKLVEEECEITILDDFFTGSREHIRNLRCEIVEGNITDVDLVNKCVSGKDIVFHLAARNIIISNKNPREDLEVNVVGSFNVFEACRIHNVS